MTIVSRIQYTYLNTEMWSSIKIVQRLPVEVISVRTGYRELASPCWQ